jgi:DNA-binding CsgD family transcriptional regulator
MAKKANTLNNLTYNEYHAYIKETYNPKVLKNTDYYLKQYSAFSELANAMPCAIYLLDYTSMGYRFVSEGCKQIIGYTADECMNWSHLDFISNCMNKEDAKIFTSSFFEKYIEQIKTVSKNDIKNCRFSLNYRGQKKDGTPIKILQQSVVLETNDLGYPVLSLGILIDITAHKMDNKMVFSISHFNPKTGFQSISSNTFESETNNLTVREKEIVKHIAYGHSTIKIAELLNISVLTVNAHRRNINKKTNCKNVAELINYAISNSIK